MNARGKLLNKEPEQLSKAMALPCPFCGQQPFIQFWHGGRPGKQLIGCPHCEVGPSVTGETKAEALTLWNQRV
jgi:Lar family restriction alleviation protein